MSIALDLPKDNPLRGTIDEFKKRFEEYSDEHIVGKFSRFPQKSTKKKSNWWNLIVSPSSTFSDQSLLGLNGLPPKQSTKKV